MNLSRPHKPATFLERADILLVEISPGDARVVTDLLAPYDSVKVRRTSKLEDALFQLADLELNLVILDLSLPGVMGYDAIAEIREKRPEIGIITLTGPDQIESAAATLRMGADDFIVNRDITSQTLEKSIRYVLNRKNIENERDVYFSVSLDLICVAGPDGYFKQVNPAFLTVLGYTPQEMCSRPIVDFVHPDDLEATYQALQECAHTPLISFENRYRCKNGTYKYLSWKSVPLDYKIYATARDMTEQRELRAKLVQADRMIAVGTLATGVAHEINNPLAYLLLNLHQLRDALAPGTKEIERDLEKLRENITRSLEAAERVRDVVRDLKLHSRDEASDEVPVKISDVIGVAVRMSLHQIQSRAQLELNYAPAPLVKCNVGRMSQVFLNLLINAAQAIPEGNAANEKISVTVAGDENNQAIVEIRDSGTGMIESVLSRIFDPFFTTKPVGVGTGLGLYICHGIVKAAGGTIEAASAPGQGTSFRLTFPAVDTDLVTKFVPPSPEPKLRRKLKVLVIDDEILLAEAILVSVGKFHDVEIATDGEIALKRLRGKESFDIVLCDLMMPGKNGMEIYESLSADKHGMEKRMVFMTGGAFTTHSVQFLERVKNPKILKPFELKQLLLVIEEWAAFLPTA